MTRSRILSIPVFMFLCSGIWISVAQDPPAQGPEWVQEKLLESGVCESPDGTVIHLETPGYLYMHKKGFRADHGVIGIENAEVKNFSQLKQLVLECQWKEGPSSQLPYHVLLTMEKSGWVQKKPKVDDPKFTPEELSKYIWDCMENGGFVTINLSIHQDGTVGEKALEVMKGVK